jgi:nucleoside-diphosphate-sugar epimerase
MQLEGKKVLVTGADGFIGSHLVERLIAKGSAVRAFVMYNSFNSWGWLDSLSPEKKALLDVFSGDIRDPNGVFEAMQDIDVVFHLAALIGIPFSYHSPDCYVDTNIKGTLNVLQAARRLSTGRILVTSTSEVYGTALSVPIGETHPRQPQSPYSATKIAADGLAESFFRSFDLPVTIVRPFNTYGPRPGRHPDHHHPAQSRLSGDPARLDQPHPRPGVRDRHRGGLRAPGRMRCRTR